VLQVRDNNPRRAASVLRLLVPIVRCMARVQASQVPARPQRRRVGVIIIDPLPVVRAGLRLLIDDLPDMDVVEDVGTGEAGLEAVGSVRRSKMTILVGIGLAGALDAFSLIRELRERFPGHVVLALGANADAMTVSRALFVGADGFVDKNLDPAEFLAALRRAAHGEVVVAMPDDLAIGDVVTGIDRRRQIAVELTEREREVLSVAAEGLTARQIADRLGVRERTITTHLARIYGKLGVRNRLSAIRIAARSGLVTVGGPE
jgi:DNA-binding NarL/FixJ family response regulator